MKPYTMDDLHAARRSMNYVLTAKIAAYLMMFGLEEASHLRACEAYAWSREMIGDWEDALALYKLLETRHSGKLSALMVVRATGVLVKMGRHDAADRLLVSMERDLQHKVTSDIDRRWVLEHAREVRQHIRST